MAHRLALITSSVPGEKKLISKTVDQGEKKTMKRRKTLAWRLLSVLVVLTMLVPTTLSVAPMPVVQAADTGWHSPSANEAVVGDGDGDGFEDSADNAYADDCNWASNIDGPDDSHLYYNFGIDAAIPADAVISGIIVGLDGRADSVQNSPYYEVRLSWDGGANWSSPRSTPTLSGGGTVCLPPSDPEMEVGGQSDLWGHTPWSTSELSNANFRVRITSRATGSGSTDRDFFLERVSVGIIYASAHITGTIWSDDDADGNRDGGEAGLNDVLVTIYQDDGDGNFEGGGDDTEVDFDYTDDINGAYETGPFMDGYSYWIDVDAPAHYTLTTPPEPRLVSLPDANSVTVDFGYEPPNLGIVIEKTPDSQTVVSGSTVTFTITITNTSEVTLTNVTVSDAQAPNCDRSGASSFELNPGEGTSYDCTLANVLVGFTNNAVATGTPPVGSDVTDEDDAVVSVISPVIEIAKTPDDQTVPYDSTATFTITVTNTGDVALTNVTVSDALVSDCNASLGSLVPTESTNYSCSLTNAIDDFTNSATVTGTDIVLLTQVSDTDIAAVNIINPDIAIVKMPDEQIVSISSTATFTITVTNTGDVPITEDIYVTDAQTPSCNWTIVGGLGVGADYTYNCDQSNVTDGFINSALVTARPPVGPDVTDVDAAKVRLDNTLTCPVDMLAYWNLDETSGSTYDDFYDGHDGECAGTCPTPATGFANGGQAFDGSDTGIDVPVVPGDNSFDWGVHDSFSVEFWMRRPGTPTNNEVVVGRDDSATDLHWWTGVGQWAGNVAAFCLFDTAGVGTCVTGDSVVTGGDWHHIVAVRNATADTVHLYVDGEEEDVESVAYLSGFDSSTSALNIGWIDLIHGFHLDGTADEIALHDRALSPEEVLRHYGEGLVGQRYCESGPFAPFIYSDPVTDAAVGREYVYDVQAAGNPVPTYTLLISPTGMTIDSITGVISWTPTLVQEGNHNVQIQASNTGGTDTQDFTIVVHEGTLCPADMLAYWKLDETSGTDYYDFYDGHDGGCALTEDCPAPADGHIGGAQEFTSTTGIDVPADVAFSWVATDSFSIEYWMQTDSASTCAGNEVVIGRDDSSSDLHWWTGCWNASGGAVFVLRDRDGVIASVVGTVTDLTDGNWHHVVAVHDASAQRIRIYVDGDEEGSTYAPYTSDFGSAVALNVGWLDLAPYYHFNGLLDELAIYDRALSPSEIEQHYNDGESGPGYCINPGISVDKVADPPIIYPPDTVLYSYLVTNPGDDPLSSVDVSDDNCAPIAFFTGDADGDNELDPTESWIYTCEMTPTVDITNIANVTGTYSLGGIVTATDTAFVNAISPGIAVDKVADPTIIYPGDAVTYTYTVTNPGDDPLDVSLSDDQCSPLYSLGGDDNINGELDPGEIWTYGCTAIVSVDITNTVTVTGTDSAGGTVNATDTAFVDVINPAIEIAKTPDNQMVRYGSTSTFTIIITNTSDTMLTNITVFDALASDCDRTNLTDLAPTESTSYTCTQDNVMADFTNTAVVTGTPPVGPDVSDTDAAFVDVIGPSIEIAKTPDNQTVRYNSTATFTIAVTNTGDVPLTNVVVLDVQASDCVTNLGSLAPTESASYTCGVTVTADFTNTATVVGTPPVGPNVSDADTAFVDLIGPGIVISKSPDTQMLRSGSAATFTIAVTNTGDATLTNVVVSDALVPDCNRDSLPNLAPTGSTSYTCTVTNVMADFTNRATVTGTPPVGIDVSHTDTAFVDVISPSIAIAKTPVTQTVRSDSTVTFTIAVTNTGDVILTNVTVSDALVPDCDRDSLPDLAPTGSMSYTCTVTNVMANFTNIATVTGTPPVGPDVSGSASAFVYVGVYEIYLPLVLRG